MNIININIILFIINSYNNRLTYQENYSIINLKSTNITNFYSKWPEPLFYNNCKLDKESEKSNKLNNIK